MSTQFLNTASLPYCKGCGHDLIAKQSVKALENSGVSALDIIMVTDIGCHGIIDKCMNTHTVHGLHGRSSALGAGISFGLENPGKKVIVFIGDGGATIGLQHIMEAARLNLNMTVVLHNNMLYGMTGGQTSGLTPQGFATTTSYEGNPLSGYDICALAHTAGASFTCRAIGVGDISDKFENAFKTKGFSMVEIVEICPSYGVKLNPKRKITEIVESSGRTIGEWRNERPAYKLTQGKKTDDLLKKVSTIEEDYSHSLKDPISVVLSGSAGEGVQLAAAMLSKTAIRSGLDVTQKGSYPVTVGVGFSTAELNFSPEKINFHGINVPDVAIITSQDGLQHNVKRINKMKRGVLYIDSSLEVPETGAQVIQYDFRGVGAKNAALTSIIFFAIKSEIINAKAILKTIEDEAMDKKVPVGKIKQALDM